MATLYRDDVIWSLLFAKALPADLPGYDIEAQRRAVAGAWDSADRTLELTRDEAQLRAPNFEGGAYAGERPSSQSGGGERPYHEEKSAPPVGGEQVPEAATPGPVGRSESASEGWTPAPAHGAADSTEKPCAACQGFGVIGGRGSEERCDHCGGSGVIDV